MSKQYNNTNSGALFKNKRKESDKHPDYTGALNVNGHDYWLSAWINETKSGEKIMKLAVKQKDGNPPPTSDRKPQQSMYEDDIPF